jgi:Tol biopolymer transport system component
LTSNPEHARGLYVADIDGSTARRIAHRNYLAAAWSPDGTQIAAISVTPEGRQLDVMNADGTDSRVLVELDDDEFTGIAWHPLPG